MPADSPDLIDRRYTPDELKQLLGGSYESLAAAVTDARLQEMGKFMDIKRREVAAGIRPAPEPKPLERPPLPFKPRTNSAALRGRVSITLQTIAAQRLAAGRQEAGRGPSITGLMQYAKRVRLLHQAARIDDPYADWYLLRITGEIEQAKIELAEYRRQVDAMLQRPGLDVDIGAATMKFDLPLTFSTPHAFQGAYLLLDMDDAVRRIMTAVHIGLLDRDEKHRRMDQIGHVCRRVFACANSYVYLELTREAMQQHTARAAEAVRRMGELPPAVLSGDLRDAFAPDRRRSPPSDDARQELATGLSKAFAQRNERWAARHGVVAEDEPAAESAGADIDANDAAGAGQAADL